MVSFLGKLYARRIVNVNVNILLAGVLALGLTVLVIHFAHRAGVHNPWSINFITVVADVVFDVVIYYFLHWLANHLPNKRRGVRVVGAPQTRFFRDATLVQFQRMMLSPFLYAVMLPVQHILIQRDARPEVATAVGMGLAICTTRILHTIWMVRQQLRMRPLNSPE